MAASLFLGEATVKAHVSPLLTKLDRIFDDYGLIGCGWSGDHDPALVRALDRCGSRRIATFWAARGSLSREAEALARRREAEVVQIVGADEFFGGLGDACEALADFERPHPLTIGAAVVTAKRELAGHHPRSRSTT